MDELAAQAVQLVRKCGIVHQVIDFEDEATDDIGVHLAVEFDMISGDTQRLEFCLQRLHGSIAPWRCCGEFNGGDTFIFLVQGKEFARHLGHVLFSTFCEQDAQKSHSEGVELIGEHFVHELAFALVLNHRAFDEQHKVAVFQQPVERFDILQYALELILLYGEVVERFRVSNCNPVSGHECVLEVSGSREGKPD